MAAGETKKITTVSLSHDAGGKAKKQGRYQSNTLFDTAFPDFRDETIEKLTGCG